MTIEVLKRKNKYILILILSCIFTISTCKLINKVHANNTKDKGFNVLVLNSYHQGHIWESSIFNGLLSYIENNNERDINFNIEYLDFKNNNNKKYIKSFKNMLNEKYAKGSIDAVYTVDDEAYDVFSPEVLNKESNFYKLPLVFSGVDSKISRIKEEKSYIAGIYHEDDSLNLINLIYDLNPKIKNINLIIEDSKYGDSVKYEIESSDNTVNIIAGEFQSISSKTYKKPKYIVDEIKKYSNAPIYSNDQTYMNAGVVGGHIDMGEELGEIACDMLVKLRKGVSIEDIKNTTEPIAKAYVDYKSIYEYNINSFFVDKDVNVINKEFFEFLIPIWMKLLILIIIIIVIIILILVISQIATKHRKIKEKELEEKQKALERERLKSDFIGNLSHELRTPINIILGTLEF
ncbi:hybrid sensory histidine kinase BarA [uncultured Clostridium sp.]|nr:hybrid sensory histidine kinase BarA [uncultured Clostridium sp.]SCJ08306.1 hybrid sensory histidine kinase BarA [uncultured Clostridium sp.]